MKRDIYKMIYDVLNSLRKNRIKPLSNTQIMYKANLSYQNTHILLNRCREKGLLCGMTVTRKGYLYLNTFEFLEGLI